MSFGPSMEFRLRHKELFIDGVIPKDDPHDLPEPSNIDFLKKLSKPKRGKKVRPPSSC
jgi:hypothetical protein